MAVLYTLAGVFGFIWFVGLYLFLRQTGKREIEYRSWQMVLFSSVFSLGYVIYFAIVLEDYFSRESEDFAPFCIHFHWVHYIYAPGLSITNALRQYNLQFNFYWNKEKHRETYSTEDYYFRYKWTATPFWNLIFGGIISLFYFVPNIIVLYAHPPPEHPNSTIDCFDVQVFVRLAQELVFFAISSFMMNKLIRVKDPFGIKTEQDVLGIVGFILFFFVNGVSIYQYFVPAPFPKEFTPFYSNFFYSMAFFIIIVWLPVIRLYKESHRRDDFRHLDITLNTILSNPRLLEKFKEIASRFWCPESLLFLVDATKYHQAGVGDRAHLADEILDKYIKVNAILEINIDSIVRKTIIASIQDRDLHDRLFESAVKDVSAQLVDVIEKWKQSTDFTGQVRSALSKDESITIPLKPIN